MKRNNVRNSLLSAGFKQELVSQVPISQMESNSAYKWGRGGVADLPLTPLSPIVPFQRSIKLLRDHFRGLDIGGCCVNERLRVHYFEVSYVHTT